jgi:hypothetical protein
MKFIYPLELKMNDQIAVKLDDDSPAHYERVTAVYRQGDKAVVETDRRMLRLDPGLKVQALA